MDESEQITFDLSDDFMLDRSLEVQSPDEKLNALIGLKAVKEQIEGIIAARILEKRRKEELTCFHSSEFNKCIK